MDNLNLPHLRAMHAAANGHNLRVVPGTAKIYTDSSPSGYVGVCVWASDAQWLVAIHNAFPALADRLEAAERERGAARKENEFMHLRFAESGKDCMYCGLPASDMPKCASGFPGCARADDMFYCDELTRRDERMKALGAAEAWYQVASILRSCGDFGEAEKAEMKAARLRREAGE